MCTLVIQEVSFLLTYLLRIYKALLLHSILFSCSTASTFHNIFNHPGNNSLIVQIVEWIVLKFPSHPISSVLGQKILHSCGCSNIIRLWFFLKTGDYICSYLKIYFYVCRYLFRPSHWSRGQHAWLLTLRSRVRLSALTQF